MVPKARDTYIFEILDGVCGSDEVKHEIREEFSAHIQIILEEQNDSNWSFEDLLTFIRDQFGDPKIISDQINLVESKRSILRDPNGIKAVFWTALAVIGFIVATKLVVLFAGLSTLLGAGPDLPHRVDNLDHNILGPVRFMVLCLSGVFAFWIGGRLKANPYRSNQYVLLPIILFVGAYVVNTNFYIIEALPLANWEIWVHIWSPYSISNAGETMTSILHVTTSGLDISSIRQIHSPASWNYTLALASQMSAILLGTIAFLKWGVSKTRIAIW